MTGPNAYDLFRPCRHQVYLSEVGGMPERCAGQTGLCDAYKARAAGLKLLEYIYYLEERIAKLEEAL